MIRREMIIINISSEAILRNNFASVELEGVGGLSIKFHLASFNGSFFFKRLNLGQYSIYNKKVLVEIGISFS